MRAQRSSEGCFGEDGGEEAEALEGEWEEGAAMSMKSPGGRPLRVRVLRFWERHGGILMCLVLSALEWLFTL